MDRLELAPVWKKGEAIEAVATEAMQALGVLCREVALLKEVVFADNDEVMFVKYDQETGQDGE